VSPVSGFGKRILVGRALAGERLHETLLPQRIARPVFASDVTVRAVARQHASSALVAGRPAPVAVGVSTGEPGPGVQDAVVAAGCTPSPDSEPAP